VTTFLVAFSFPQHNIKQIADNYSSWRVVCIGSYDEAVHEEHEQRRQAENDDGNGTRNERKMQKNDGGLSKSL
jgi:hypothetical protein